MPLPTLQQPASAPFWLLAGHSAQWASVFADVAMCTGHRRKRRVVTARPQVVSVSLLLEREQMAEWSRWFRDSTRSGERHFAARVKEQGPGFLWYEAAFEAMPQYSALYLGRWRVDVALRLIGVGTEAGPVLGSFHTEAGISLTGSAVLHVGKLFHTESSIALIAALRFHTESGIELEA